MAKKKETEVRDVPGENYGKKLLGLAKDFQKALSGASVCTWAAAKTAHEMRSDARFAERAKKGEKGWVDFCRSVLRRDESTVNAYCRGWTYVEKFAPDMLKKPGTLPPVSLCSELAAVRENVRQELHDKLFSGDYSASEFRSELISARDAEYDDNQQDGPKDPKQKKTTPGSKGTRKPTDPNKPRPQMFLREKLGDLFPESAERIQTFPALAWRNIDELTTQVAVMLTDGERRLDGWSIVVIPPRTTETEQEQEGGAA